jgi:hypothetical protein
MSATAHPERAAQLLGALGVYRLARQAFLVTLGLPASNRDPLAEFSEQLVHALMGGTLALSRVQADYDLVLLDGTRVQVRYLANRDGAWVNEHLLRRIPGVELYALVLFEAFTAVGVLVFPTADLAAICAALGKRHPRQEATLQFTRRNFRTIRDNPARFQELGIRIWLPDVPPP